ncbi:MAG: HAD family phosphatase [Candidatus Eiseniibacteriota bacterium]|jgi:HAD superfamily hydrolase (TIGR01509 family)
MSGTLRPIVFDLDGVLIDSEPAHFAAEVELLREHGFELAEEVWQGLKGLTDRQLFRELRARGLVTRLDDAALCAAKLERLCRLLPERARPFPAATDVVRQLAERRLALVTSSAGRMVALALEMLGLVGAFEVVVTGEEVRHGKPDPEPFALAAQRLGVDAASCIAVEDSVHGVAAAVAAGMTCIAVLHSFAASALTGAHHLVPAVADVPAAVAALEGAHPSRG